MKLNKNKLKKKKKKKRIEKRKIKLEDEKNKEDSMWERLHVLNTQFKKNKTSKKRIKKDRRHYFK